MVVKHKYTEKCQFVSEVQDMFSFFTVEDSTRVLNSAHIILVETWQTFLKLVVVSIF